MTFIYHYSIIWSSFIALKVLRRCGSYGYLPGTMDVQGQGPEAGCGETGLQAVATAPKGGSDGGTSLWRGEFERIGLPDFPGPGVFNQTYRRSRASVMAQP